MNDTATEQPQAAATPTPAAGSEPPPALPAGSGEAAAPRDLTAARPEILQLPVNALAVDVAQAGAMLGVSTATIRREIDRGRLRAARIGRVYRVRVAELHAYLKRQEVTKSEIGRAGA